jgi:hypothetical protein
MEGGIGWGGGDFWGPGWNGLENNTSDWRALFIPTSLV